MASIWRATPGDDEHDVYIAAIITPPVVHLQKGFGEPPKVSLKALLASAPREGIELDRSPGPGLEVDL